MTCVRRIGSTPANRSAMSNREYTTTRAGRPAAGMVEVVATEVVAALVEEVEEGAMVIGAVMAEVAGAAEVEAVVDGSDAGLPIEIEVDAVVVASLGVTVPGASAADGPSAMIAVRNVTAGATDEVTGRTEGIEPPAGIRRSERVVVALTVATLVVVDPAFVVDGRIVGPTFVVDGICFAVMSFFGGRGFVVVRVLRIGPAFRIGRVFRVGRAFVSAARVPDAEPTASDGVPIIMATPTVINRADVHIHGDSRRRVICFRDSPRRALRPVPRRRRGHCGNG